MALPTTVETEIENVVEQHDGTIKNEDERIDAALVGARGIADSLDSLATMGAVIESGEQVNSIGKGNTVRKTMHQAAMDTIKNALVRRLGQEKQEGNETNSDDLTDDEFGDLVEAGASVAFLTVVATPLRYIDGVDRSLAHEEIHKHFERNPEGTARTEVSIGGGFLTYLWNGELFEAYRKADNVNQSILQCIFDKNQIIADGVVNADEPLDYVRNIVNQ